ncbi:asparaginase [Brevibacillus reuszeri]|uniref:Asparaginase n=1 Tax=Brevibacillus reuszeri TaxID=54915 RepID=A0A0K9YR07_9BACL|nr:asparaginase [Brevibacillus reuszeri]KNB70615.1 L-asparaginase [Brevibacillus reuszeri]MED1861401.1 asparaginase [Brevibacillus reuszeri]GED69942.1 asparaginase [Brevibacillus reuszeri]
MEETMVIVKRGTNIESKHAGSIAVMDSDGNLLYGLGDFTKMTFTRSALKPVQTIPVLQSGAAERFLMTDKEIAICCGSHNGEEQHTQVVESMLFRIGLQEENLQCGAHPPYNQAHYLEMVRKQVEPSAIHNNCSGKHAGMLALAMHLESDIATYHYLEHPVQRKVAESLAELAEIQEDQVLTGIDGCGVPNFSIPLHKLALVFAKLANPDKVEPLSLRQAIKRITHAMLQHPEMISGTNDFCTELMRVGNGKIIAKGGAEGVYCLGLPHRGIGIAIKVEDGNWRAATPAAVEVLKQLGELTLQEEAALKAFHTPVIENRKGEVVGSIEPFFQLKAVNNIH